jgi:hypothetical protein
MAASFLDRSSTPASPAVRMELAQLCIAKQLYRAAARFYREAFAAQRKLADNLDAGHRYVAARAAALAGSGKGKDADQVDAKECAGLRRQALMWLRADLEVWGRQLGKGPDKARSAVTITRVLQHWLADTVFSGVRGLAALAKLPEAEGSSGRSCGATSPTTGQRPEDRANEEARREVARPESGRVNGPLKRPSAGGGQRPGDLPAGPARSRRSVCAPGRVRASP